MKVLVMGLPGSGKTYLSERLQKHLDCAWYNADKVREMANDWGFDDFSRFKQAMRMRTIADFESAHHRIVICDFVCPTVETRETFEADYTIFMDTIEEGRFEDTNKIFVAPTKINKKITEHLSDEEIESLANEIAEYYKNHNKFEAGDSETAPM